MDLFDLGDGCDSLLSGVARITCPVLVRAIEVVFARVYLMCLIN